MFPFIGLFYASCTGGRCRYVFQKGPHDHHGDVKMDHIESVDLRVGEFLVEHGIISRSQLDEALSLQKDNQERLIGEILVTQGILTKEDLIMALEMYLMVTDSQPKHVDEWLDQDEVDMLMEKMRQRNNEKNGP